MISQNTPIQASEAILSRTLHITVTTKGHNLDKKRIADRLSRISLEDACTYMTHCLKNEAKILQTYTDNIQALEEEFHQKGITHTRIALCHAQVSAMIDALEQHVLTDVIDLEEVCDAKRILEDMARERVDQLSSDHPMVQQFWDAYEYMNVSRSAAFSLNHHDHDAQSIAINLNEVYKVAARNYQSLPDINEMRTLLRSSRRYKFIEMNKPVKSKNFPADEVKNVTSDVRERVVKCWLFVNPYYSQQHKASSK